MNETIRGILLVVAGYVLAKAVAGMKAYIMWYQIKQQIKEKIESGEIKIEDLEEYVEDEEE